MQEEFSDRIRKLREEKGLSQSDLAKQTDLQPSAISHFETGRRSPSTENLRRLADAFGVSTDFLLGRVNIAVPVGPTVTKLLEDFAQMSAHDQDNVARFATMLARKTSAE